MLPAHATRNWRRPLPQAAMCLGIAIFGVSNASPTRSSADALFARGDFAAARIAYAQEVTRNPNDIQATLGLARLALYENELDAAADSANKARALDPGSGDADRILATVAQRRAVLASASGIELPREGVSIPFIESEPLPLIQARIDGRIANLLLDTGAPDVMLHPAFAQELGLAIVGGRTGQFAGGRTAMIREATVHSVGFGPIVLHDLKVLISPTNGPRFYKDRSIDGIVGTVFLSRFLATIDYPHHRLVLQPRLAKLSVSATSTVVPMWLVGDHYVFVRGSVNGLKRQMFFVDSGSTSAGFIPWADTVAAAHITLSSPPRQATGGGGTFTLIPIVLDQVCLGSACQQRVRGTYAPGESALRFPFLVAGIVSHLYLEHYRVTFDFARMKLVLSP